jgi:5-(carboxyamino)imidazole ribonucleotide mutase
MLATSDPRLTVALAEYAASLETLVAEKNAALQAKL